MKNKYPKNCIYCKKEYFAPNWELKKRLYCSKKCFYKSIKGKHSDKIISGNGARKIHTNGTIVICNVGDKKNVYEHRYIMEQYLGRNLSKEEVVHHKDHNKSNNNISNLMLCKNTKEHRLQHANERIINNGGIPKIHKICSKCKKVLLKECFYKSKAKGLREYCKECCKIIYMEKKNEIRNGIRN